MLLTHPPFTFRYSFPTPQQIDRLLTTDTKAINHILTHSVDYQKPENARAILLTLFGEGLLFAEGTANPQFPFAISRIDEC